MKLVITGATGFIGRNLAERFHDDGLEVLATGRSPGVGAALRERGIEFRAADLLDAGALAEAFSPADCVIHCAGKAGDWGTHREFHEANVVGTRNVVEASRRHGIAKLVFVSTPSIYYTGEDRFEVSEDEPIPERQLSPYGQTKLAAETELDALRQEGLDTIILRPRAVYGPYESTFFPRILQLAEKKNLPLINGGRAVTDITYIDNFTDAVRRCLTAPENAWNQAYNIVNGEPIRIRDWFATALRILDRPFRPKDVPERVAKMVAGAMELASHLPFGSKKPSLTRFAVGYMARSMTLSIEKARDRLGYVPAVGNEEGFERYAEWVRS